MSGTVVMTPQIKLGENLHFFTSRDKKNPTPCDSWTLSYCLVDHIFTHCFHVGFLFVTRDDVKHYHSRNCVVNGGLIFQNLWIHINCTAEHTIAPVIVDLGLRIIRLQNYCGCNNQSQTKTWDSQYHLKLRIREWFGVGVGFLRLHYGPLTR